MGWYGGAGMGMMVVVIVANWPILEDCGGNGVSANENKIWLDLFLEVTVFD